MEQLKKYIIIDHRFQKSVNLYLDLGDRDRINSYIPTQSSLLALIPFAAAVVGVFRVQARLFSGNTGQNPADGSRTSRYGQTDVQRKKEISACAGIWPWE